MFKILVDKIVDALCKSGLVTSDDKEIYQFGVETALLKCIHISTMLLIGLSCGLFLETLLYLVFYLTLRIYAGGYHAKTKFGCYAISWLMIISVVLLTKYFPFQTYLMSWTFIPFFFAIFFLAPVSNKNKPLDSLEKQYYGKTVRKLLAVVLAFSIFLYFTKNTHMLFIVYLSIVALAMMLIIGFIQNRHLQKAS
ncbi:hypothetical protein EQM14_11435 [Caproiciproducens sp. NJN-50]|uniref:accessory gene regulator ArgB-like protein n=1 Tax=Acutalibacteraceae TaxID=3082771 RepID=UPI000FFE10A5|nr:accessory gene regulator B family protein [Caproicibacter sp. BJN0012]QAT50322.1 hypothetical protein EQM14_11435 [Caproiciproducens sp. NJN-50]